MNISPQFIPDPKDVAFFDQAADLMKRVYILHGQLDPMALIEHVDPKTNEPKTIYLTQAPLSSPEEKMKFVASIQLAGITVDSKRSVVVLESWSVITDTPEKLELMREIKARGGSIREHPDHVEVVTILLESDRGSLSQTFKMNRLHEKMVELVDFDELTYYDREDKNAVITGDVTGFHIPTDDRKTEEGLAYARMLSDTFSLTPGLLPDPALAWKAN
jgi:hypothetical protein